MVSKCPRCHKDYTVTLDVPKDIFESLEDVDQDEEVCGSCTIALLESLGKESTFKVRNSSDTYILCAAVWIKDGKAYAHQPQNVDSGLVLAGRRHHNCFTTISNLSEFLGIEDPIGNYKSKLTGGPVVQGFITSTNLFVDRREAHKIAFKAGQTNAAYSSQDKPFLISEMVW